MGYMLFVKKIQDATGLFGPDSMNVKRLKHRFAAVSGEDFDTFFLSEADLAQKQQEAAAQQTGAPQAPGTTLPGNPSLLNPGNPGVMDTKGGQSHTVGNAIKGKNPAAPMAASMMR
jgi:hypothetical protein